MKKLVIIPAYNEEKSILATVSEIIDKAPDFDYVVINDCSTDNTKVICQENGLNFIDLPINLGIGGAVQTGYRYALDNRYGIAVQADGDGQHDPSFLNDMLTCMNENKQDMVIGSRFLERRGFQSTGTRRVGIKYFNMLIKIMTGKNVTDPTSGLRMVNTNIIRIFAYDYPKDYPEPESVVHILKMKKRIMEIPVIMRERQGGVSSISPQKSIYYMVKVTLAILIERIRRY